MTAKPVKIMETVLRDGHQSLLATRMRFQDMESTLEQLDNVGYAAIEAWGGATFDSCLRFLNEDPWERLRGLRKHLVKTPIQMLLRGQNVLGYNHYADDVVREFVMRAVDNGVGRIRIFDALNDVRNMETSIKYPRFKDFNEDLKYIYKQPVTLGLREPFYQFVDDTLQDIVALSHKEKDKSLKDLMNSISIVYYGLNFTSPKQIEKYRNALLESGRNALMLARQQYRHFELRYLINDMVELLKDESEPFMKYCEHDKKLTGFTKELDIIKTLFTTKIYLTEDEKKQLIQSLMSLAKRCIYTHVFLSLNERKIINEE